MTGAVIFGLTYRSFMPQLKDMLNFGALPLTDLWNLSSGLAVTTFALVFLLILYIVDRTDARRPDKLNQSDEAAAD